MIFVIWSYVVNSLHQQLLLFLTIKASYLVKSFTANCEAFKVEVIDGKSELAALIAKFKKFDSMSVQRQVLQLITKTR